MSVLLHTTSDLSLTFNLPQCWGRGKRISLPEEIKIKHRPFSFLFGNKWYVSLGAIMTRQSEFAKPFSFCCKKIINKKNNSVEMYANAFQWARCGKNSVWFVCSLCGGLSVIYPANTARRVIEPLHLALRNLQAFSLEEPWRKLTPQTSRAAWGQWRRKQASETILPR